MANEFLFGISIGAALQGSFKAAFASADNTVKALGSSTEILKKRQERLGSLMSKAFSSNTRNIGSMRREYDRLGSAIDSMRGKQERLTASIARGKALSEQRKALRGQAMETIGTAAAIGAPVIKSVMLAASFEDALRGLRIEANLSADQEASFGKSIREVAREFGQSTTALASGVQSLILGGMSAADAQANTALLGKTMLAFQQSESVVAGAMGTLADMGMSDQAAQQRALDQLVAIGQTGQFTPSMMVQAFSELGDTIKKAKLTENDFGKIAAGLQVAEGAMGADAAKAGLQSWIESISSNKTDSAYEAMGVNYGKSMAQLQKDGLSKYEASIELSGAFIRDKLSEKDQKALLKGDDDGRIVELLQQMGMGEVFRDANAARFALEQGRNKSRVKELAGTQGAGGLDEIAKLRAETTSKEFEKFRAGLSELGITIGSTLLPPLNNLLQTVSPVISSFAGWAAANPGLVSGIIGIGAGIATMKIGLLGAKYGLNLVMTGLNGFSTFSALASARGILFSGHLAKMGQSTRWLSGHLSSFQKAINGGLLSSLKLVGQGVLWIGRALMANPIGLVIGGIALGAYLIYKYWEPISDFFIGLWNEAKAAVDGGIGGISALILNWSPMGLFYKAIQPVLSYFGIELPASFSEFGANIIGGLIGGITSRLASARESIVGFGESVKGWFTSTLGIQSPSTVFAGFGDNIAQGAAIGIQRSSRQASGAAGAMAADVAGITQRFQEYRGNGGMAAAPAGGGMTINFSPTIQLQGGAGEGVAGQVAQALKMSVRELEVMIDRVMAEKARRNY